jgi:hypothetical protein
MTATERDAHNTAASLDGLADAQAALGNVEHEALLRYAAQMLHSINSENKRLQKQIESLNEYWVLRHKMKTDRHQ